MLGKLIKYDLKYGVRIFILIHSILLIACILGRFFILNKIDFNSEPTALTSLLLLLLTVFILLFTAVFFGLYALLVVRFYKNLFTNEGYLTWTLPASPTQQLWAKIISGAAWCALDTIICTISLIILVSGKNVTIAYAQVAPEITKSLGMSVSRFGLYMLVFMLLGTISCIIIMYLSVAIGQLFSSHRILFSIIAYFIINSILQIFTFVLMIAFHVAPGYSPYITGVYKDMSHYMLTVFKLSLGLYFFIAIAGYFTLHYIINKKINLN